MPYKQIGETKKYVGLSTDVKPTKVDTGDEFLECKLPLPNGRGFKRNMQNTIIHTHLFGVRYAHPQIFQKGGGNSSPTKQVWVEVSLPKSDEKIKIKTVK